MVKRKKGAIIDGWILIDKPAGMGSTPVVGKVKRGFNAQKAGHAGTLDPFATGVLPIALGMATKTIPFIQDGAKQYIATLQFGSATDTLDTDGTITHTHPHRPMLQDIIGVLPDFLGNILQTPPVYSAIKVKGKRAYDLARSGQSIDMPSRMVHIKNIQILSVTDMQGITYKNQNWDSLKSLICDSVSLQVECTKGTYMRTLGQDIALKCATVGHLIALKRTKVGCFSIKDTLGLANFEKMVDNNTHKDNLLSVESALVGIPVLTVVGDEACKFKNGVQLICPASVDFASVDLDGRNPFVVATDTHIYGWATWDGTTLKSTRVFSNPVPRRKI